MSEQEKNQAIHSETTETIPVEQEQTALNTENAEPILEVGTNQQSNVIDPLDNALNRIAELEEELAGFAKKEQEILLRSRAEIENIRRRTEQDIEKAHKFALEKFSKELLTVIDNLERALATESNREDSAINALFEGVELTLKDLLGTVGKFGIVPVGQVGETFNPDLHEAISMQPTEGFSKNQITQVLQKGYLLNDRILRPAMVMVAA